MNKAKTLRICMPAAVWASIKSWTDILSDQLARQKGQEVKLREGQTIAAILSIAAIDSDAERHKLYIERLLHKAETAGFSGPVRTKGANTSRYPSPASPSDFARIQDTIANIVRKQLGPSLPRHVLLPRKIRP